jgi:hypothetical protein
MVLSAILNFLPIARFDNLQFFSEIDFFQIGPWDPRKAQYFFLMASVRQTSPHPLTYNFALELCYVANNAKHRITGCTRRVEFIVKCYMRIFWV